MCVNVLRLFLSFCQEKISRWIEETSCQIKSMSEGGGVKKKEGIGLLLKVKDDENLIRRSHNESPSRMLRLR